MKVYIDLTKYGSHVYVLVRRGELRASAIMAKRLKNNPKIVSNTRFNKFTNSNQVFRLSFGIQ